MHKCIRAVEVLHRRGCTDRDNRKAIAGEGRSRVTPGSSIVCGVWVCCPWRALCLLFSPVILAVPRIPVGWCGAGGEVPHGALPYAEGGRGGVGWKGVVCSDVSRVLGYRRLFVCGVWCTGVVGIYWRNKGILGVACLLGQRLGLSPGG